MKKIFKVKKSSLYASVDYTKAIETLKFLGYELKKTLLPPISIESGAVCFFDPYSREVRLPFCESFPKCNAEPFALSVSTNQGYRVALAGLKFTSKRAFCWKKALLNEKDVIKIDNGEIGSYTVGSGYCSFADYVTERNYVSFVREFNKDFHPLDPVVAGGISSVTYNFNGGSIPVFYSGWGEGTYACYIGIDEDGKPCALVCDFMMVQHPKRRSDGEYLTFEFEVSAEEQYVYNPALSESENNQAKWTMVINTAGVTQDELFNAYARRGYSLHNLNRKEEALLDYLAAIDIGEKLEKERGNKYRTWTLYENAGAILLESGREYEAEKLFAGAKNSSDTFYAGAYLNLINIYIRRKDYESALKIADEMVCDRPADAVAYMRRAEIHVARADYEKAIEDLDVLIYTYKMADNIIEKAECLSMLGKLDQALKALDEYIYEAKADEFYFTTRASLNFKLGNFNDAYGELLKAIDSNPDYLPALEMLIELDSLTFNVYNQVKWATKYIDARPDSEFGYSVRIDAHMRSGNYDYALDDCVKLVNNVSSAAKYRKKLVVSAVHTKNRSQYKKSLKYLRKTDNAYYLNALGVYHMIKGRLLRAERYLTSAIMADEDEYNEEFLFDLFDCYTRLANYEKASECIDKLEKLSPDVGAMFTRKIILYKAKGDTLEVERIKQGYIEKYLSCTTDEAILKQLNVLVSKM